MELQNSSLRRNTHEESAMKNPAAWFRADPDVWAPPQPSRDPDVWPPPSPLDSRYVFNLNSNISDLSPVLQLFVII